MNLALCLSILFQHLTKSKRKGMNENDLIHEYFSTCRDEYYHNYQNYVSWTFINTAFTSARIMSDISILVHGFVMTDTVNFSVKSIINRSFITIVCIVWIWRYYLNIKVALHSVSDHLSSYENYFVYNGISTDILINRFVGLFCAWKSRISQGLKSRVLVFTAISSHLPTQMEDFNKPFNIILIQFSVLNPKRTEEEAYNSS